MGCSCALAGYVDVRTLVGVISTVKALFRLFVFTFARYGRLHFLHFWSPRMSQIKAAIGRIKQASFDVSLTELAKRAGVPKSTARGLLKEGHSAVENLIALEAAAEEQLAPPKS